MNVIRECRLERTKFGLYDLEIRDDAGRAVVIERGISKERAMGVIEEKMYGRKEERAEVWP